MENQAAWIRIPHTSLIGCNIAQFVGNFGDLLREVKVRVVTLVATGVAQANILDNLQKIEGVDLDFRSCEILSDDKEKKERAKALCVNLGGRIYKQIPLGFGNLGLLVVFSTTVPNNSLPILHSFARTGSGQEWKPLFPRVVS